MSLPIFPTLSLFARRQDYIIACTLCKGAEVKSEHVHLVSKKPLLYKLKSSYVILVRINFNYLFHDIGFKFLDFLALYIINFSQRFLHQSI